MITGKMAIYELRAVCRSTLPSDYHRNTCKDLPMLELLLKHGANLDTQDSKGETPLYCLVGRKASTKDDIEGQIQLARRLLDNMDDLDTINHDGNVHILNDVRLREA